VMNIFVSSLSSAGPTACLYSGINRPFLIENSVCSLVETDREVLVLPGGADRLHAKWDGMRCSWIGYRWGGGAGVKFGWKDGLGQVDRGRLRAQCRGPESQRLVVRMGVKLALPGQLEYYHRKGC